MTESSNAGREHSPREPGALLPAPRRREALLLGALLLLCALHWSAHFEPFVFPNSDYHSFERTARSLARLELPGSFKRGPILPALMALLAPAMPGPHPELHAALAWNAVFSLGELLLLFRLASLCFGEGAGLFALMLGTAPVFHDMALQPLVEPSLAFFVLLTFLLLRLRSPWQYAAAGAAALSRAEAATLIAVLFAVNWTYRERLGRQVLLAGLASLPFLGWNGLGALRGSGMVSYLELMRGMGWTSALSFPGHFLKELFFGYVPEELGPGLVVPILAAGVPGAVGAIRALRESSREAVAMLAFLLVSTAAIVAFGVDKSRYIHSSEWIPLVFFALGVIRSIQWLAGHLAGAIARAPARTLAAAALVAWLATLVYFHGRLAGEPHVAPITLDLAFLWGCLGMLAVEIWWVAARARSARLLVTVVALALLTPVLAGDVQRMEERAHHAYYHKYAALPAARWLGENLGPTDRVATLHRAQVLWVTDLAPRQVVSFRSFGAESLSELETEMRERGVTHVAYTWRAVAPTPEGEYYYRTTKTRLAGLFEHGGGVPGFEKLATLPCPEVPESTPAQIYRIAEPTHASALRSSE